jgi:hypothetical protein
VGEAELAAAVMQFGTAGLIGWLWLTERRSATTRERQLHEAHDRLMGQESQVRTILSALESNTRALVMLEAGQRELARAIERSGSGAAGTKSAGRQRVRSSATGARGAGARAREGGEGGAVGAGRRAG